MKPKMKKTWEYVVKLNNEAACVGEIHYLAEYFDRPGIVNPLNGEPYRADEILAIQKMKHKKFKIEEQTLLGLSVIHTSKLYWYDAFNANIILKSSAPLILDPMNGNIKNAAGEVIARSM